MLSCVWKDESIWFVKVLPGTSQVAQWLRLPASNAGDTGLIPGWGTKIPHVAQPKKKKKISFLRYTSKFLRGLLAQSSEYLFVFHPEFLSGCDCSVLLLNLSR